MQVAVAMAALAVHPTFKGFTEPLILLQPAFLPVPANHPFSSFLVKGKEADRAGLAVQPTGSDPR